jgi:phosphonate transport system permease protein
MLPPDPGSWSQTSIYLKAMGETLSISLLGTLGGAVLAFPMALLAARNVVANRIVHFLSRRWLDTVRGVDTLIWALIWVSVVGLGPFAGILALMCSDFGSFGKLFSEAIETADKRPVEGVLSTGGDHLHGVRFGLLPQIIPVLASQVLYYFESNTRSATIIGIVGAGGIGAQLSEQIRVLEWQKVAFIILLILITVALIDWVSSKLRFAIIGRTATTH